MKDLKQSAEEALKFNKHLNEVFVASNGTVFVHKNDAVNYAAKLDDKTVAVFERDGVTSTDVETKTEKVYTLNGTDTIKLITAAMSEEAVNTIIENDERKTVIAASQKRIAELKQLAIDQQAKAADEARLKRETENPNHTSQND